MIDIDKWQEIFHSLSKNPLRTTLTAFGVFWGIFMLVVMMGAGKGLENGATKGFAGMATNSLYVWNQSTSKAYNGLPPGRQMRMTLDDMAAMAQAIPEARIISPINQLGGWQGNNSVTRGNRYGTFGVSGNMPNIFEVESPKIIAGRFINPLDIEEKRKVAVIGPRVREILFDPEEDPIGDYIYINGVYFKVIGTFDTEQDGSRGDNATQKIYIPFSTFQQAFNYGSFVGWIAITSQDNVPVSVAEEKVLKILKARHRVAPDDNRAFGHFNLEERFNQMSNTMTGINLLSWFVGICTLIAGVIGISNIMLVLVKERTKEIGIRRALGARPISIVSLILMESVFLTTVAGYLGLMSGLGLLELYNWAAMEFHLESNFFQDPSVDFSLMVRALVILVLGGAFAGFIPARRALSISPVDALRAD
ncbi:MAG: ABC transporter permease [Bacteroidia bacterium]|nr:ABC transporter permease [Bacteroidia bacterium]